MNPFLLLSLPLLEVLRVKARENDKKGFVLLIFQR